MTKSEFGKGLVICLVKFAEHFERDIGTPLSRLFNGIFSDCDKESIKKIYDGDEKNYISSRIGLWANGASDHLYEIEVPEGKDWDNIRKEVKKLQNKGLEMGHGFRYDKIWTLDDFRELMMLTRNISLMIDKKLGLKPDIGDW